MILTPSGVGEVHRGIDGSSIPVEGAESWTVEIEFAQDVSAATALTRHLFNNVGTIAAMEFVPVAGGQSVTCQVALAASAIGGDFGAIAKSGVTLKVVNRPTFPTS